MTTTQRAFGANGRVSAECSQSPRVFRSPGESPRRADSWIRKPDKGCGVSRRLDEFLASGLLIRRLQVRILPGVRDSRSPRFD